LAPKTLEVHLREGGTRSSVSTRVQPSSAD
jgi:hypothetical protein